MEVKTASPGLTTESKEDASSGSATQPRPFSLFDLNFGSEEAERDELLDKNFVQNGGASGIIDKSRSIIVGDRGSGKSAIFRRLAAGVLRQG